MEQNSQSWVRKTRSVKAQCLRFVHLGLRSILVLFKKAKMDENEVLVNFYLFSLGLTQKRFRQWIKRDY